MMPQTPVLPQTQTLSHTATCATCPFFQDYGEEGGWGWCSTFDRLAYRHHRATDGCRLAIKPLLDSQPLTVMVELASKELDPDEDYPVPLHSFITEVTVTQPSLQAIEKAIASLGYSQQYNIVRHWIPQDEDEF
jgi:hypothetical protein